MTTALIAVVILKAGRGGLSVDMMKREMDKHGEVGRVLRF